MRIAAKARHWADGWIALLDRDAVGGYRALAWHERLRLDCAVAVAAIRSGGFWKAVLILVAGGLAAQILVWEHDLRGAARDALQCLPAVLVAPWVAAGRRRRLECSLAAMIENGVTAGTDITLHSAASQTMERERWRRFCTAWRAREAASGSGGSTSCWRSRVSRCWRRWRSRASRA